MSSEVEDTIRAYLHARSHPRAEQGVAHVALLYQQLEEEREPLERLRIRSLIERAGRDFERLEERFVQVVRDWSDAQGFRPEVWEPEPIPREVLRRAGLLRSAQTPVRTRRRRRARPLTERVLELAGDRQQFSAAEMAARAESDEESVRYAIKVLISKGVLVERGLAMGPTGRLRTMYQRRGE